MNNRETFLRLLQRYIDDKVSDDERRELMMLIRKGIYDDDLNALIGRVLEGGTYDTDMDELRAGAILRSILSAEEETLKIPLKQPLIKRRFFRVGVAAAGLLIVIVTGWTLLTLKNHEGGKPLVAKTGSMNTREQGSYSGRQYVRLPDGSTVMLNDNSQLSYNMTSGHGIREVSLTGEGYFDIQHDTSRPFLVHIGDLTVTVLGTAFNVRAYPDDNEVQVAVTRGRVQVSRNDKTYGIITPDEQILINTVTHNFSQSRVDAESVVSWKNNYLVIDNMSMEDAMQMIAGKYDVSITISDKALKRERVTATFLNDEDLEHVLTVICEVINATYIIDEQGNIQIIEK